MTSRNQFVPKRIIICPDCIFFQTSWGEKKQIIIAGETEHPDPTEKRPSEVWFFLLELHPAELPIA